MGSARSSSEIITQWQPPLEEHRNGHILGYVIRYRLKGYDNSPWTHQNITNEAQRNYLIQDLITWKDYNVQIAAYNDKGVGVFSDSYTIKTKEGVPEAAPDSVRCEAYNSTAVQVWWTPPNPQKINGINQVCKLINYNLVTLYKLVCLSIGGNSMKIRTLGSELSLNKHKLSAAVDLICNLKLFIVFIYE